MNYRTGLRQVGLPRKTPFLRWLWAVLTRRLVIRMFYAKIRRGTSPFTRLALEYTPEYGRPMGASFVDAEETAVQETSDELVEFYKKTAKQVTEMKVQIDRIEARMRADNKEFISELNKLGNKGRVNRAIRDAAYQYFNEKKKER